MTEKIGGKEKEQIPERSVIDEQTWMLITLKKKNPNSYTIIEIQMQTKVRYFLKPLDW